MEPGEGSELPLRFMAYLDPPRTLKWGPCSFYLGILRDLGSIESR